MVPSRRLAGLVTRLAAAALAAACLGCGGKPPSEGGDAAPAGGSAGEGGIEPAASAGTHGDIKDVKDVASDDPRAVVRAAQQAMKARRFGLLFDLLSQRARDDFYADLRADAGKAKGLRYVQDVLGYDPAQAATLPPVRRS